MIVEQVWTANAYRNFNYLIACPETGEAPAIRPSGVQILTLTNGLADRRPLL